MNSSAQGTTPAELPSINKRQSRPYTRRSKDQWKTLLSELESSGLTHTAFCKQHRISPSNLYKWRKYFSEQGSSTEFIDITEPLSVASPSSLTRSDRDRSWQVELELGCGVVLRLRTR